MSAKTNENEHCTWLIALRILLGHQTRRIYLEQTFDKDLFLQEMERVAANEIMCSRLTEGGRQ